MIARIVKTPLYILIFLRFLFLFCNKFFPDIFLENIWKIKNFIGVKNFFPSSFFLVIILKNAIQIRFHALILILAITLIIFDTDFNWYSIDLFLNSIELGFVKEAVKKCVMGKGIFFENKKFSNRQRHSIPLISGHFFDQVGKNIPYY